MSLNIKKSIGTGGTSGIGKAIVEGFAKDGAEVVLMGRSSENGFKIEKEIVANCGKAYFITNKQV